MRVERMRRLLPHEWLFAAFLLATAARLLLAGRFAGIGAWVFVMLPVIGFILIRRCEVNDTSFNWRLRLFFAVVAMNAAYTAMRGVVPAFNPTLYDRTLQAIDHALIGQNLSVRLQTWVSPTLTEVMSLCYMLLMPYLLFSLMWYLRGELSSARRFYVGLFSVYAIGFMGYTLLPAHGPYLAMPDQFHVPLDGGLITDLNRQMVLQGSNRVDVFPSLHCAASAYMLLFDYRYKRWRFWLYVLPCIGLWLSTLYLRYHYFIDLMSGFVLALIGLAIALRYEQPSKGGALELSRSV